ncbi:bifunctional diguanylate cyclase/phosphodiesterase [Persephonella sp. IF05-L8]|uniref:EAL domain-containing protein n=1 Tax=Persephonella sp. IF05-L8 TaxID=1158338 RepID=UPI0004960C5B
MYTKRSKYGLEEGKIYRVETDKELNILQVSQNEFLGYKDIIGKNFVDLIQKRQVNEFITKIEELKKGKNFVFIPKLRVISADKKIEYVDTVILNYNERICIYLINVTDSYEKEKILKEILELAPVGIFLHIKFKPIFTNPKVLEITEMSEEELKDFDIQKLKNLIYPPDWKKIEKYLEKRLKGIRETADYIVRIKTPKGKIKWVHVVSDTVFVKGIPAALGIIQDVTKSISLERAYKLLSSINRTIINTTSVYLLFKRLLEILVDTGDFKLAIIEKFSPTRETIPIMYEADKEIAHKINIEKLSNKNSIQQEFSKIMDVYFAVSIPIIVNGKPEFVLSLYSDTPQFMSLKESEIFTEIAGDISLAISYIRKEHDLFRKEYFDNLTGIGNRRLLFRKLDELISEKTPFYLILIDIYNFKHINEVYGEETADLILKQFVDNIRKNITLHLIFRSGSDEIAVIYTGKNIINFINKLKNVIQTPLQVRNEVLHIDFNMAVVEYPKDARYRMELLLKAERTLEIAKKEGKNTIRFFNKEEYIKTRNFLSMEEIIENALRKDLFFVKLHPIVSFKTGEVVAAETLIRLQDENGNYISPSDFIPVAEQTGQIVLIDDLVLKKVNEIITQWKKENLKPVKISVNVTPSNIKNLVELFYNKNSYHKIQFSKEEIENLRNCVIFELTEREFAEIAENKKEIETLRKLGFEIAIDDFGTGYSNLNYLAETDIDFLKIDIYFVRNMLMNEKLFKLVKSIINIAKIFDIKTIAEGVEKAEEYTALKELGCDCYQGYHFCKPLPPEEFKKYLKKA